LQIRIAQFANRSLQRRDGAACRGLQDLESDGGRKELDCALISGRPDPFDPVTVNHRADDLAGGRPVHAQRGGEVRGLDPGTFPNGGQRAMHADRGVRHPFQLAIKLAHAINQGTCREQHDPFTFLALFAFRCGAGQGGMASSHFGSLDG